MTVYGKVLVGVFMLCSASTAVFAQEMSRGQALYENQCRSCHESWAHERKGRSVVTTREDLQRRVAAWATHSGLDWTGAEIDDVTDYLDQAYYHFGIKD